MGQLDTFGRLGKPIENIEPDHSDFALVTL